MINTEKTQIKWTRYRFFLSHVCCDVVFRRYTWILSFILRIWGIKVEFNGFRFIQITKKNWAEQQLFSFLSRCFSSTHVGVFSCHSLFVFHTNDFFNFKSHFMPLNLCEHKILVATKCKSNWNSIFYIDSLSFMWIFEDVYILKQQERVYRTKTFRNIKSFFPLDTYFFTSFISNLL